MCNAWISRAPTVCFILSLGFVCQEVGACNDTAKDECGLVIRTNGRRRFPAPAQSISSVVGVPSCANPGSHVGCVPVLRSGRTLPPSWAGALSFTPPICQQIGGERRCKCNLPTSVNPGTSILRARTDNLQTYFSEHATIGSLYSLSVAVGDVNGDGAVDVVVGRRVTEANELYLNNGMGKFSVVDALPGSSFNTRSVVLGDFNGDGSLDVVFGQEEGPNLMLVNDGSGNLARTVELPGGAQDTQELSVGDVNGDGYLDLVVVNGYPDPPQLLLNNGTGFDEAAELSVAVSLWPPSLALGDLDNDGWVDVAGRDGRTGFWMRNNRAGGFDAAVTFTSVPGTGKVALSDVDGDGWLDMVLATTGHAPHLVRNLGGGMLEVVELTASGSLSLYSLALGDVDGDGRVDVLLGTDGANLVLLNQGNASFAEAVRLPHGAQERTYAVALSDLDGDGASEVLTGSWSEGLRVLRNTLVTAGFSAEQELPGEAAGAQAIAAGDLDGDGSVDVVLGRRAAVAQTFLNDGSGGFQPADLPSAMQLTYAVATGDVNGDGRLDLVVGADSRWKGVSGSRFEVLLMLSQGVGAFGPAVPLPGPPGGWETTELSYGHAAALALGDVDGDGALDLVVGLNGAANLLLTNNGTGGFERVQVLPGGSLYTRGVALGDVDGDGWLDIVVGNWQRSSAVSSYLLSNNGSGGFNTAEALPGTYSAQSIALGDVDGDGWLDVVVGTDRFNENQLLGGAGAGSFAAPTALPGGTATTNAVALADLNGDGWLDAVIGNEGAENVVLWNDRGELSVQDPLPGGQASTEAVAVADVDGDGRLDIVVANLNEASVLLRGGACVDGGAQLHGGSWCFSCPEFMGRDGTACVECLPDVVQQPGTGELCGTETCVLGSRPLGADACTRCDARGGVYFDSGLQRAQTNISSWHAPRCAPCTPGTFADGSLPAIDACFACAGGTHQPLSGQTACEGCEAGTFQTDRGQTACDACEPGGFCAAVDTCGGGFVPCQPGSFNPNSSSSARDACQPCPRGSYSPVTQATSNTTCRPCRSGSFSDEEGLADCQECDAGSFQDQLGATACLRCSAGHFCPRGAAAPLPCPPGSSADRSLPAMRSVTDCLRCPPGSYCPAGAGLPAPCAPGTFAPGGGADRCELCEAGSFSEGGATACEACGAGKYADQRGQGNECTRCPHPLSSSSGATECGTCEQGFYLRDERAEPARMLQNPAAHCLACSAHAECPRNTSLETLVVPLHFWRDSLHNPLLFRCRQDAAGASQCLGSNHSLFASRSGGDGRYCARGHRGPRCAACEDDAHFFSSVSLSCEACDAGGRLAVMVLVLLGAGALWAGGQQAVRRVGWLGRVGRRMSVGATDMSVQAKFKICVSFLQVFNTLDSVYGVHLHPRFAGWLRALSVANVDALSFLLPGECLGSMSTRLWLGALAPLLLIAILFPLIVVYEALKAKGWVPRGEGVGGRGLSVLMRLVYAGIFVLYLVLPSVSRAVFSARLCESFGPDTRTGQRRSYPLADLDVRCGAGHAEYEQLQRQFWMLFVVWTVLIPAAFLLLLVRIRGAVRSQRVTPLAEASRFLWRDYSPDFVHWEVLDLARKLALSSLVLFFDPEHGSSRVLRLALAALVSAMFLAILALARPYKHPEDLFLACTSNLLLACCFVAGIVIKLCEEGHWQHDCEAFVGIPDSADATVLIVLATAAMLLCSLAIVVSKTIATVAAPTIRLASTRREPSLDLPPSCRFHIFVSHVWSTGQDQTHTLARQLQLLLPDIRIWLDVDCLDNVGRLEEAVADAAVFVVFLSQGYFASVNCRRELYAALASQRPMLAVRESEPRKGGATVEELKAECRRWVTAEQREEDLKVVASGKDAAGGEVSVPEELLGRLFAVQPVVWVRVHDFQVESLKQLTLRVLAHLPAYQHAPQALDQGLTVPGELGAVGFATPVTLLVCHANTGALAVAEELRQAAGEGGGASVRVRDAQATLDKMGAGREPAAEGDVRALEEEGRRVSTSALLLEPRTSTASASAVSVSAAVELGEEERKVSRMVLLVYLNARTFDVRVDEEGALPAVIRRAMDMQVDIALVHEQDPAQNACAFREFLAVTPKELQLAPYRLYDIVAHPLYPTPEHRRISLRNVLKHGMGARPLSSLSMLAGRRRERVSDSAVASRPETVPRSDREEA